MFKKLRDKITEEVKQSAEKFPVNIQQFTQFSQPNDVVKSPEGASGSHNPTQEQLLVDVSEIKPVAYNSDLFSIDEDNEGSPSKASEFEVVELNSEASPIGKDSVIMPTSPLDLAFPGTPTGAYGRPRRNSTSSSVSDASSFFPIYEVPPLSSTLLHSDLESCASEWDESSNFDRLNNDAVYQAYMRMRQRYHKYKGRYADTIRATKENEKEMDKMRDVLAKTQDKSVRRISELREQCTLEQQAKAHLEQELRSDLEEKDHKIAALMTKVKLIQEGYLDEVRLSSLNNSGCSEIEKTSPANSILSVIQHPDSLTADYQSNFGDGDDVSVLSFGSVSTAPTSLEADELIERLKGDVTKHKSLLTRCFENIRNNKKKLDSLSRDKNEASDQLQEQLKHIDILKTEHCKELQSLRAAIESSALSMAETKQQFFNELQTKEFEVEHFKTKSIELEKDFNSLQEQLESVRQGDTCEEQTTEDAHTDSLESPLQNSIEQQSSEQGELENLQEKRDASLAAPTETNLSQFADEKKQLESLLATRDARISELEQQTADNLAKMSQQQSTSQDQSARLQESLDQNQQLQDQAREMEASNIELHQSIETLKNQVESLTQQLEDNTEQLNTSFAKEKEHFQTKILQEKDEALQQMITDNVTTAHTNQELVCDLKKQIESSEQNIKQQNLSMKENQEALVDALAKVESVSSLQLQLENKNADLCEQKELLLSENEELKTKYNAFENERQGYLNDGKKLVELISLQRKLEDENKALKEAADSLQGKEAGLLTELQTEISQLKSSNEKHTQENSELTESLQKTQTQLTSSETKLQELLAVIAKLEEDKNTLTENQATTLGMLEEVTKGKAHLSELNQNLQQQESTSKAEQTNLRNQVEQLTNCNRELEESNKGLSNDKLSADVIHTELVSTNAVLLEKLKNVEANVASDRSDVETRVQELTTSSQELEKEITTLKANQIAQSIVQEELTKEKTDLFQKIQTLESTLTSAQLSFDHQLQELTLLNQKTQEDKQNIITEKASFDKKLTELTNSNTELVHKLQTAESQLNSEKCSLEARIQELTVSNQTVAASTEANEQLTEANVELSKRLQQLESTLNSEKCALEARLQESTVTCTKLEQLNQTLNNEKTSTVSSQDQLTKHNTELSQKLQLLEAKCGSYDTSLREIQASHDKLLADNQTLINDNSSASVSHTALQNELTQIKIDMEKLQHDNTQLLQRETDSDAKTCKMQTYIDELTNQQLATSEQNSELRSKLTAFQTSEESSELRVKELSAQNDSIRQEVAAQQLQFNEVQQQLESANDRQALSNDQSDQKNIEISELRQQLDSLQTKLHLAEERLQADQHRIVEQGPTFSQQQLEERLEIVKAESHNHFERTMEAINSSNASDLQKLDQDYRSTLRQSLAEQEQELQLRLDRQTDEWNIERKELERLTQAASSAFKSGTDSVDLLKKQVGTQRKEIEELKHQHRNESADNQRRSQSNNLSAKNKKIALSLEDVPEFDYLRNILFQYMIGTETQTLSKVLCAVVKFDREQKRQICDHEEGTRSMIASLTTNSRLV